MLRYYTNKRYGKSDIKWPYCRCANNSISPVNTHGVILHSLRIELNMSKYKVHK